MENAAESSGLERFRLAEAWTVEPSLNRIDGPSGSEALNPKAMEVLVFLAAHAGEVVSKDTLLDAVWPDTFVSDQVLANAIWELRRAFGDSARAPRFIQTVPKRGYRLLVKPVVDADPPKESHAALVENQVADEAAVEPASVDVGAAEPSEDAASAAIDETDGHGGRWRWVALAAILGVVAIGVWVVGLDSGPRRDDPGRGTRSDAAWQEYQLGLSAVRGVREDALVHLRRAVELDPSFAAAHAELADFYDRQGDADLAVTTLDRALELAADRPEVERVRYRRLRARILGDVLAEEKWLRRLAVLDDDPEVRFDLSWFLFAHFRYCDESVVGIRGAIEVDPRPHFFLYLGEVAMSCGLHQEALAALEQAVAARPEEASYHGFRSYLQLLVGDVDGAARSAARALELAPDDPWIVHRRALVLHRRYRFDEALDAFRRARGLQLGASGAAASAWAGEALVHLDRDRWLDEPGALDDADEAADRILALVDPPSPEALAIRGLVDLARGDRAAARRQLEALDRHFAATKSRYDIHYRDHLKGRWLAAEGRWREAAEAHADGIRSRPLEAADHRIGLARALLGAGEVEEAIGGLYRLFDIDPNHAEGRCLAAVAHERAERQRAADEEWAACEALADALGVAGLFEVLRSDALDAPSP